MAAMVATAVWETVKYQIAAADAGGSRGQLDRIRAVADTDGVGSADNSRESRLEGLDLSAEDIKAAIENPSDGGIDRGSLRDITGARISLRNLIEKHFRHFPGFLAGVATIAIKLL
jgi:hypothetical protein